MAQEWCVLYGVMEEDDAAKAYKRMLKRKGAAKAGGGKKNGGASTGKKSKKAKRSRVLEDVEYDAGMDAGGDEGIGIAAL